MSAQDPVVGTPDGAWSSSTTSLRTRAEVDAELVATLRAYMDERYRADRHDQAKLSGMWDRMAELSAEPTAPEDK